MNTKSITSCLATCAIAMMVVFASPANGSIVAVSNLAPPEGGVVLKDSSGAALPAGSEARVGTFAEANIRQTIEAGREALLSAFRPFGEAFSIGDGAGGRAGLIEAAATEPVDASSEIADAPLFFLVGNTSTLESSTEFMLVELSSESIPVDFPGGIESYAGFAIDEGRLVHGTRATSEEFRTESIRILPPPFDEWIADQLPDVAPADLLPGADPDGDGIANLGEFALGSDPGDPASRQDLGITLVHGRPYAVFNRRIDEPDLSYTVEEATSPAAGWQSGNQLHELVEAPSPPPPAGYEQVRQELHGGTSYFARLLIDYSP